MLNDKSLGSRYMPYSFCSYYYYYYYLRGRSTASLFADSLARYQSRPLLVGEVQLADDMLQVAKNEIWASEVCSVCLGCLLERSYHL